MINYQQPSITVKVIALLLFLELACVQANDVIINRNRGVGFKKSLQNGWRIS